LSSGGAIWPKFRKKGEKGPDAGGRLKRPPSHTKKANSPRKKRGRKKKHEKHRS